MMRMMKSYFFFFFFRLRGGANAFSGGDRDDDEDDEDDEDEEEELTEADRMEQGRKMFQIFAARMFEQRVLTAYREKVRCLFLLFFRRVVGN